MVLAWEIAWTVGWAVDWGLFESHMPSQPRAGEAVTLGNVSLVYGNLEKSKQAIFYQEAITIYEEICENNQLLTQDVWDSYVNKIEPIYRQFTSLLHQQGRPQETEQLLALLVDGYGYSNNVVPNNNAITWLIAPVVPLTLMQLRTTQ